ncbi:MAG: HAD family hydrolase [Candidatus Helarchaeota archaeon]|nr:HAD family hydrolase [Candidatus Helarchaeota archaeon]
MVLIFDMDGVLVRSTFFSERMLEMLCQRFQDHNISIERTDIFQDILKLFVRKLGEEDKVGAYDWDLLAREYLEEYNITWTCEIEDFFNSGEIAEYTCLYKDTEVLEWLLQKGYTMVILTNGLDKYQNIVIEKLGLQKFFKKTIMPIPKVLNFVKPDLEIFRLATEGFQGPHTMIGDSLFFDIYGAKKAGYNSIWIVRRLPKKYKELSIRARTEEINQNDKFLLRHILRSAPFLKVSSQPIDPNDFKPDYIIKSLQELKELF